MVRPFIVDNLSYLLDKTLFFDAYDFNDTKICGINAEKTREMLREAVAHSYFLFSEEEKNDHISALRRTGFDSPGIDKYVNLTADNYGIIDYIFSIYLPDIMFISEDNKAYILCSFSEEKNDFGFDLTETRTDYKEFVDAIKIIPLIDEIRTYFLNHTFEEYKEKYNYDYYL